MKKNALSFFAFFFYSFIAWGQPFAVEANLQLQAPLTPYLSDIVSGAPSKIQVQLLLRDDDELSYSARLHFTISGQGISIRTRQDISPPPIFLDYNVPVLLSGLDLFDYFQLDQLEFQGISPQDFLQQGGRLPEGVYNICVEVLDYNRFQGAAVSNQACTVVELSEWDPPLITSPIADVPQQAAQNILFQWIPQHLGSFPVSYRFRLWEQREGLSVNQILQQTLPLYETQQLSSTSLLYGTDAPPLFAGQSYIVQVQAQDILGQQQFKNEGRSQHLIFTYGSETINTLANDDDLCTIRPQSLAASALTIDGFMAHWEALPNVDHYAFSLAQDSVFLFPLLEYQDIPVIENQYRVQGLEEGIYYYRIRAIYENCESPFSTVIPVRLGQGCLPLTEDMSEYSCGTATDPLNFEPSSLLEYLRVEDTIRAHDFKVVLQDVRGQGSFSGQGYVQVPYLQQARVNVQFEGIKVDEYCRLVAGKMEVTGAGLAVISTDLAATIDSILGALEILEAGLAEVEDILEDAADFQAELEDIEDYLANGQSVLENLLHLEEHFPYLPQEATDAIQAAIDCLKNAQNADDFEACKAQMLAAIDQLKAAMESLYDADFRVNFGPISPPQFGFDSIRHIAQAELYHKIPIAETDYWVPWQSLPSQQAGQVKAWAPSQSTFPEDIQFKDGLKQSIPIVDSQTASDKTLQLQGQGHEQSQTVYALQPYQDSLGKDQVHIAGQLNLISYTPKTVKVVLVPVNGTQYPHSIEALRQQLDHIFGQAIVDIDLSVHTNLPLPEFDNQMDSVPSGFLANYTDEMQLIRNRFKAANTIVEDTYYLFLVESSQDPSKLGYMPKKKPFGFIYHQSQTTEAQYTKTIAHELAHGAFHLSHSFQDSPALPPGEMDNLMDYAQGLHLQKYQWDLIHNPAANWTLFDGDEEGEYVTLKKELLEKLTPFSTDGYLTFLNNLGEPVSILEEDLEEVIFATGGELYEETGKLLPIGTLTFFKLKSGVTYRNCATGKYYAGQTSKSCIGQVYNNPAPSLSNLKPIIVRPCYRNNLIALNIVSLENYQPPVGEIGYDYLLPYFFTSSFSPQGILFQTSNTAPYFDLSEEFSDPTYKALIQQYPNLAEYGRPSSFYINGAALILKHYQESYNYCATEQMVENLLKIISIPNLAVPNPASQINNTVPPGFYESFTANASADTRAFVDDLFSQLKNSPSFLAQSGNPTLDQLIQLFMHRNELLLQYQALIDNASEGNLSDFITFFKNTFFQLKPCELDKLTFSYPKIKTLIEAVLTDNWFWVSNRDERLILKLINQVPVENYHDFLIYLESRRLPASNDWLWMELIKRVDNSWFDENGKKLVQQLSKIWKIVAQTDLPENIFKKRVENLLEEIDRCDQEDIDTFDQEELTAVSRQVVPYHYRGVINRLMDISSAGWLIPNVGSLTTDVQVNETTGQLDIHQNLKLFVIKAGSDLLPPRYGCQPFTPLILDKYSTYGLAKTLSVEGFTIVPAFIFYFLERQARTQTTEDLVFTSIDIATLPIPITKVHKVLRIGKALFRFDKASSAASIAGTLSQEDFPKISKFLNTTSALLGLTTLGAEGWLRIKSFRTNGTIRKVLGEISKAASDASLADRVKKLNDLLTEIEALTPLQLTLLKGKSNIPALSEVILKGGQELIDEGADIGRQRINDAIRILNSDMLTFLRNQLESIGANAQLIERVTILEESKAIALTLDLTNAGPDFLRAFNLDVGGGLIGAWEVPFKHGGEIRTNVPFLTKLSDDLSNPQFPTGSSATANQLTAALDNPGIFDFYKKFHDSPDIGDLMRQRYLEAVTLSDAGARKVILESVLNQKKAIRDLGHLSDDLLENLARSNLADGTATFTSINGSTAKINFVSISGIEPSQTLINMGKLVVPKGGSNSTRFFKWTNPQRAQDSEAKILEYIMDQVASARGINIPQGANKADYIDDVLDGANLQIVIKSEMEACSSCTDVIRSFNNANTTPIDFSGGTKFYEQYGG